MLCYSKTTKRRQEVKGKTECFKEQNQENENERDGRNACVYNESRQWNIHAGLFERTRGSNSDQITDDVITSISQNISHPSYIYTRQNQNNNLLPKTKQNITECELILFPPPAIRENYIWSLLLGTRSCVRVHDIGLVSEIGFGCCLRVMGK